MAATSSRENGVLTSSGEISLDALKTMVGGAGSTRHEPIDPQLLAGMDPDADPSPDSSPAKLQEKVDSAASGKTAADVYKDVFEMTHKKVKLPKPVTSTQDAAVTYTKGYGEITPNFSGTHFDDRIAKAKHDLGKASADVARKQGDFDTADANRGKAFEAVKTTVKSYSEARETGKLIEEAATKQLEAARKDVDRAQKTEDTARQRYEGSKAGLDTLKDDLRKGPAKPQSDMADQRGRSASLGGNPVEHGAPALKDLKTALDQTRASKAELDKASGDLGRLNKTLDDTKRATQEAKNAADSAKSGAKDARAAALGKLADATTAKTEARDALDQAQAKEQQQAKNLEKAKENVTTKEAAKQEAKTKGVADKMREYGGKAFDKLAQKAVTALDKKVKAEAKTSGTYAYTEDVRHYTTPVVEHEKIVDGNRTVEKTKLSETAYRESQEGYSSAQGRGAQTKVSVSHMRYDETKTTVDHGDGTKTTTIDRSGFYAGAEGEGGYKANVAGATGRIEDKLVLDWTDETIEIKDFGSSKQVDTEGYNVHSDSGVKVEGSVTANGISGEAKIYTDNTSTTYKERAYTHEDGSSTTVGGKVFSTAGGYAGISGDLKLDPLDGGVKAKGKMGAKSYAGFGGGGSLSHHTTAGNGAGVSGEIAVGKIGGEGEFDFNYDGSKATLKISASGGAGLIGGKGTLEITGDVQNGLDSARRDTFFDYTAKEKAGKARIQQGSYDIFAENGMFNKYSAVPSASSPQTSADIHRLGIEQGVTVHAPPIDGAGHVPDTWVPAIKNPEPSFAEKLVNTALIQPKFWLGFFR